MLRIKQHKCIWVGIIVLGVVLLGMPAVYAQDEPNVPEWVGSATEEGDSYDAEEEGDLEALGDFYEDLVYTPVTPCKIVDTRLGGGGFIAAGATRYYNVVNTSGQGGSYCSSPVGYPSAAHLSVVVVDPNGQGNLKVFPANTSGSSGLSINFAPIGTNIANAGTTKVVYGSGDDIGVKSNYAGCHVTIQVLGYYTRPEATPIQTARPIASKSIAPYNYGSAQANCPSGYTITGGGCYWQTIRSQLNILRDYPVSNGWYCYGWNGTSGPGTTSVLATYAICSRIPGR